VLAGQLWENAFEMVCFVPLGTWTMLKDFISVIIWSQAFYTMPGVLDNVWNKENESNLTYLYLI